MKHCPRCCKDKPETEFNKCSHTKDKLQSWCKLCVAAYNKYYKLYKIDKHAHSFVQGYSETKPLIVRHNRQPEGIMRLTELICQECGFHLKTRVANLPENLIKYPNEEFDKLLKKFKKVSYFRKRG